MGVPAGGQESWLAGRAMEQELMANALEGAASGQPCAVVVHGEAGVGKTSLVRQSCRALRTGHQLLWGTCVHFGEASVPFAPITGALHGWLARADQATRNEFSAPAKEVLAALGGSGAVEPARLLPLIDRALNRLAERAPTVVVIDDLQWADRMSLDVLAYLIAGFGEQRLSLLMTCRDEQRGEGHPLHGWFADMRRMPLFREVRLDRLDMAATDAQIEKLLQRPVDVGLATQVYERSRGNPYLTELLVRGLADSDQELPDAAPAALRDALLANWHGLSPAARDVTRLLAAGGRPTEYDVLEAVAAQHDVDPAQLPSCLTEAQDHGVVRLDDEGRAWFRHPLLAEVLYGALRPGEGARVHASYAHVLENRSAAPEAVAADLAVHYQRSGAVDEAYRWSLVAADHAAELHASTEESLHLELACSLWEQVSPEIRGSRTQHIDLLRRTDAACGRAGRYEAALAVSLLALSLVDPESEPLLAAEMLIATMDSTQESQVGHAVVPELLEAVRLTDAFPEAPLRAKVLMELAFAEGWDLRWSDAMVHVEEAIRIARRSGVDVAVAASLGTRAFIKLVTLDPTCLDDVLEAERLARMCGSARWLGFAQTWHVHYLRSLGQIAEATALAEEAAEEVLAGGSAWGYFLASLAGDGMLTLGHWSACRELLRPALAARCDGIVGARVRLWAAELAILTGRVAEGELHLDRALAMVSENYVGLGEDITLVRAQLLLARGEPRQALDWLLSRMNFEVAAKDGFDEDALVLVARAAAATARLARDAGDAQGAADVVAELEHAIGRLPSAPFTTARPDVVFQAMYRALFDAEVARCRGESDQTERWEDAIGKCHAAGVPWLEATARLRAAEARLAGGSPGPSVKDLLRRAHLIALELGAAPLQQEIESLARVSRVVLEQPVAIDEQAPVPATLAALTAREREILAHLVAGRSNGEIAKELVISIKTVSVHVSSILRKTGTSTRLEAAVLAERLAARSGR